MKEPQRVTTKNPKKVEAGKRLTESNRKKREAKKREEQAKLEARRVNQYYGIGAVIALGVIGGHLSNQEGSNHNKIILNHTHNHRCTFQILGGGRVGGLHMCHPPYHPP